MRPRHPKSFGQSNVTDILDGWAEFLGFDDINFYLRALDDDGPSILKRIPKSNVKSSHVDPSL